MLHAANMEEIQKLVYTAYLEGGGNELKYCIKVNGAISVTTNQEPVFEVQSTPAGITRVIYFAACYFTE